MRHSWPVGLALQLVLVAACVGFAASSAQAVSASEELGRLKEKIGESRDRVGTHERKERALLEELEDADKQIAELRGRVRTARGAADDAQRELDRTTAVRAELGRRLATTQRAMQARAVALYKAGETGPLQVLFSAESLPQLLGRTNTLRRLLDHDRELAERYRRERSALDEAEVRLGRATEEQRVTAARLAEELEALGQSTVRKRALLVRVRGDRTRERELLTELERAARALEDTIEHLGERASAAGTPGALDPVRFAAARGSLLPPVDAPVVRAFGPVVDERFYTTTFRKGIEFDEERGTPVRACSAGDVRFAGWFRGYGRIVILHHGGDYFTVSGHLDELGVEVGQRVAAGDILGTVGDTGSLEGASLYFEVRRGSESLDPVEWLSPVQLALPAAQ